MVRPVNSSTMTTCSVLDDVVHIALEQLVGLEGLVEVVQLVDVARVVEVFHLEQLLAQGHALVGEQGLLGLFVHGEMHIADKVLHDAS